MAAGRPSDIQESADDEAQPSAPRAAAAPRFIEVAQPQDPAVLAPAFDPGRRRVRTPAVKPTGVAIARGFTVPFYICVRRYTERIEVRNDRTGLSIHVSYGISA